MKLEYAIRIERVPELEGGGYLASVPNLPGCTSDGDTPEEALAHVQEAIIEWKAAAKNFGTDGPPASDQHRPDLSSMSVMEKSKALLDELPEEMHDAALAYLLNQVEKFRWLKAEVQKGIDDVRAGRVREWNPERYLQEIRAARP